MTRIPLAGVIGYPVGHSRSPRLHGHWLREYGIAGHYVPLEIAPGDLADALDLLPRMGFRGINVTVPHKEAVLDFAAEATDRARRIGAANTLTFTETGIHADNTDGIGFLRSLAEGAPGWTPSAGPALVLGAGGAARAVLVALIDAGVPEIRLTNRTRTRADVLARDLGGPVRVIDWPDRGKGASGAALVVNTTLLGMTGQPPLDFPAEVLDPAMTVTDIVYTPLETPLLRDAAAVGCTTVDGLGMLLHQAAPGFERWFGHAPAVTPALRDAVLAP
ncbi:MAG: shikimate dehydrogenase [Rhodobacteraceae bacterium]|nr:shikimate dehydrogenase [Paracoccaceae bacterium]